jgi:hypothetical protein
MVMTFPSNNTASASIPIPIAEKPPGELIWLIYVLAKCANPGKNQYDLLLNFAFMVAEIFPEYFYRPHLNPRADRGKKDGVGF